MLKYMKMAPTFIRYVSRIYPKVNKHAKHPEKYPVSERYKIYKNLVVNVVDKTFNVVLRPSHIERVPSSQAIFVPNHIAAIDPLMLISSLDRHIFFIGKKEASKYPIVGKVMRAINSIFLDRKSLRDGIKMINNASEFLKNNKESSMVIFPEGTRTKDKVNYTLGEFHSGAFKISLNTQLPIVPVVIFGTDKVLNQKIHKRKYVVELHYLEPIPYSFYKDMTTEQIAKHVQSLIEKELEIVKKEYLEDDLFYNSLEYIKRR